MILFATGGNPGDRLSILKFSYLHDLFLQNPDSSTIWAFGVHHDLMIFFSPRSLTQKSSNKPQFLPNRWWKQVLKRSMHRPQNFCQQIVDEKRGAAFLFRKPCLKKPWLFWSFQVFSDFTFWDVQQLPTIFFWVSQSDKCGKWISKAHFVFEMFCHWMTFLSVWKVELWGVVFWFFPCTAVTI